jgi:hypothetical protein
MVLELMLLLNSSPSVVSTELEVKSARSDDASLLDPESTRQKDRQDPLNLFTNHNGLRSTEPALERQ